MSEIAKTPTSIPLRSYLEQIRIDAMTWGEGAEFDRVLQEELDAERRAFRRQRETLCGDDIGGAHA
jgi:hypothetical protein